MFRRLDGYIKIIRPDVMPARRMIVIDDGHPFVRIGGGPQSDSIDFSRCTIRSTCPGTGSVILTCNPVELMQARFRGYGEHQRLSDPLQFGHRQTIMNGIPRQSIRLP
jgi:hypothetical protein